VPQLNIFIFFDGVMLSFFFVVGFIVFLKLFLPFLCFFYKSADYLTLSLLKELNFRIWITPSLYVNYLLFLKNNVFGLGALYREYDSLIDNNFIFFGFYGINEI
jgi:hypothetical protein